MAIEDEAGPESRRGYIERNGHVADDAANFAAIALLSNYNKPTLDPPSQNWLGHRSDRERVRKSGLWNQNHVEEPYDPAFLDSLDQLVSQAKRAA